MIYDQIIQFNFALKNAKEIVVFYFEIIKNKYNYENINNENE